jgi:hypothetical protein
MMFAAAVAALAAPAFGDALTAFRDGQWQAAVTQGEAEATPASLVLAGRAILTIAGYETRDRDKAMSLIDQAEADFDKALAKAPNSAEAQLQKAIAIGYRAKLTKSPGLGKDTRRRMEAVRTANPNMALAWAAVGGWHCGAIATLGSFMASAVLGARGEDCDSGFAQALKLDPGNPVHRAYYAQSLLAIDRDNSARAAQVLAPIGGLAARDGFEAIAKRQGVALLQAIKSGDSKAAQTLARQQQPFGLLN